MKSVKVRMLLLLVISYPLTSECADINRDADNHTKSIPNIKNRNSKISSGTPVDPGHQRMLDLLADIAAKTTDEHPYIGNYKVNNLIKKINSLGSKMTPENAAYLFSHLGREELNVGQNRSAIKHLKRAEFIFSKFNAPDEYKVSTFFGLGVAYMRLGETQNC